MIDRDKLENLYLHRHLTMEEIGNIYYYTRSRISQLCKKYGIKKNVSGSVSDPRTRAGGAGHRKRGEG
jgi:hypothetical protein